MTLKFGRQRRITRPWLVAAAGLLALVATAAWGQRFKHDQNNRLIESVLPDGRSEHYEYDASGNLQQRTRVALGVREWKVRPENGHRYGLLRCSGWAGCQASAEALGGHLATIRSLSENDWIVATFDLAHANSGYWIGLNDRASNGEFVWASGERQAFFNWRVGEPNNNCGGKPEDSVHIWGNFEEVGRWNDAPSEADLCWNYSEGIAGAIVEVIPTDRETAIPAALELGTALTNPLSRPSICTFISSGRWSPGPTAPPEGYSPDGIDGEAPGSFRLPGGRPFALVAIRMDGSVTPLGLQSQWQLAANETIHLTMNDALGTYGDNTGSLSLKWMCA